VTKGSNIEREVLILIEKGRHYIPEFEKKIGIVDFCLDLEIIADGVLHPNVFLIISGFKKNTDFSDPNLLEITDEQLKDSVPSGYSVHGIGSNRLLPHLHFKSKPFINGINSVNRT
jgi:hypothetical protein